ncbi:AsmA-like C-terminal domain-containing protein [Thalassobaculum sp.]|uniref:YhdP family protein n=1 Tax=Thalassobaculum sp. TaxID=2022740 RepID=UPI0032EEC5C8
MIHRTAVIFLEVLLALVIGLVLAASVLAWRLSEGPIILDGIKPHVEEMLSPPGVGFETRVGGTQVAWSGWDRALDLAASDVSLVEPDGTVRVRVDRVAVALSTKALLAGRLAPKRIDVLEPSIAVTRTVDGDWRLIPESGGGAGEFDLAGLLQAFSGVGTGGPLSDLLEIDVSGARVRLVDDRRGLGLAAHDVSVALLRTREGLAFHGGGVVAWENGARTPLDLHGAYISDRGTIRVEAMLDRLPVDALAELHPSLERLAGIAVPVSGTIRMSAGVTGVGLSGSAELQVGAGTVAVPGLLDGALDIASASITGSVRPDLDGGNLEAVLDLGGLTLNLGAVAVRSGSGYGVTVDGEAKGMPVGDLHRYWPVTVGEAAREWITGNLVDGTVPRATVQAAGWLDPVEPGTARLDQLGGRIEFAGVTTHYFRPLPPAAGVTGAAVYDATSFDITIDEGHLGKLQIDPSRVRLRDLDTDNEFASIDVAARGPLVEALRVIDHKPLGYPTRLGLKLDGVEGQAGVRLRFELPLLKDLKIEQVKLAAAANLAGVDLPAVVAGHDLNDAALSLDLNGAGMKLSGTGTVLGARSEVFLDQRFHERGAYTSRSRIRTIATRERLAAFGLDLGDRVGGQAAVEAQTEVKPGGAETVSITADLQQTRLALPEIGWEKPAGASGVLRARLAIRDGNPVSVDEFDLKAGDMAVQATFALGPDGAPVVIDFARLKVGRTDAAGRLEKIGPEEWRVALRGSSIDLSPIVDGDDDAGAAAGAAAAPGEPDGGGIALDLRVAADTLMVTEKASLTRATLAVRRTGERLESLDLRGRVGEGYAMLSVLPVDGERRLTLRAEDAGEFLSAFDIVETVRGGRLGVDGLVTGDGLTDGLTMTARIEEFRVVDAPVLAQVLSVASFTGLADTLRGDGIRFSRARVDLTMTPGRIEARNGIAYGPGLGLKVEGAYDRSSDLMDFVGLVAPAYSLSRLIDKIPVFGELLTGGEGEGLLATEFRVRGKLDDPKVAVNPLTALTPGFLRELVSTAERPADAPVVEPPPAQSPQPGVREDRGR